MSVRYRGISSSDRPSEDEETKKAQAEKIDKASAKIHSALWVFSAVLIAYWTDIFNVLLTDSRVNRITLILATFCFMGSMSIMLYLTLWLPLVKKVTVPWEIYCPNMIPTSTALGVSCFILLMISIWPIYGVFTPIIVTILLFGFLFSSHFIPWPC